MSDLTIRCQGHTWRVHKAVLSTQSDYFSCAIKNGFKVIRDACASWRHRTNTTGQETHENLVTLHEDDPNIVHLMLEFLYRGEYHATLLPGDVLSIPEIHVRVLELADKYLLPDLRKVAINHFENITTSDLPCDYGWHSEAYGKAIVYIYNNMTANVSEHLRRVILVSVVGERIKSIFGAENDEPGRYIRPALSQAPCFSTAVALFLGCLAVPTEAEHW